VQGKIAFLRRITRNSMDEKGSMLWCARERGRCFLRMIQPNKCSALYRPRLNIEGNKWNVHSFKLTINHTLRTSSRRSHHATRLWKYH
jgi:hypothetical protein